MFNPAKFKKHQKGRTLQEVADAVNIHRSALSRLLISKEANPSIKLIDALAKAIGCRAKDLID